MFFVVSSTYQQLHSLCLYITRKLPQLRLQKHLQKNWMWMKIDYWVPPRKENCALVILKQSEGWKNNNEGMIPEKRRLLEYYWQHIHRKGHFWPDSEWDIIGLVTWETFCEGHAVWTGPTSTLYLTFMLNIHWASTCMMWSTDHCCQLLLMISHINHGINQPAKKLTDITAVTHTLMLQFATKICISYIEITTKLLQITKYQTLNPIPACDKQR